MIKKTLISLYLIFLNAFLWAQNDVALIGFVFDADTNQPLPYVNIGFVNESVGTVSDDDGKFNLQFNSKTLSPNSILQISFIGYKTIKMPASEFFVSISKDNKFYLLPEPYLLGEVLLKNDLRKEDNVGSLILDTKTVGYWLNVEALGGEIATKFSISKERTKLHELNFYVTKNNSGHIKIRINVYDYKDGLPGKNLLSKNIYHTITINSGIETINLEPYNILVDNDIVISLELIKVYGSYIDFEIGGSDYKTHSFTKELSFDKWKRYPELGMAIKLRTSYPSPRGKIIAKKRSVPKKLTLFWDTSLAMNDKGRDIEKELDLLEKYLKKLNRVDIKVIKFSTVILEQKVFNIDNGRPNGVIEYLNNTNYDGEASFTDILKTNDFNADAAIVFSNAKTLLGPFEQSVYLPSFCINSITDANHDKLQTASFYGDGHYINLSEVSVKEGLDTMLSEYNDTNVYDETKNLGPGSVNGRIISDSLVISKASIRVKNTLKETTSDSQGHFTIEAEQGNILVIKALGMLGKEVLLSKNSNIEIELIPDTTVLNEVVLYGKRKPKSETTLTPYGEKKADAIGYAVAELTNKDISPSYVTYDQVMAKIPGLIISGIGDRKRYSFARNVGSSLELDANPIIVIDDIIYKQENGLDNLPLIDIQSIQSIKALKSLASTNRYGSDGAYGAIEIRTNATYFKTQDKTIEKPSALAKNNDFTEFGIPNINEIQGKPIYIQQLENAGSFEESKSIYFNQKNTYPISIPYIINVSEYFKKWDQDFALTVLSNIASVAIKNVKALRALAYKLEEMEQFNNAKFIYKHIAELSPKDAQSYRDLAQIYELTHQYDDAMALYKQILSNSIEGVDFTGMQQVIVNDVMHLLAFHRSRVKYQDLPSEILNKNLKQNLRIVFECNDPSAEFEIQFVNPKNKFYKWFHTLEENKALISDELRNGYSVHDFEIDDSEPGEWLINLKTFQEEEIQNPTYLKYTIYRNFGLATETKEIKVLELNTKQQNVNLDKLIYK